MTITHRAFAESRHFSYEAFGASEEAARAALLKGLHIHVEEMDADPTFPDDMMQECIVVPIAHGQSTFSDFNRKKVIDQEILPASGAGEIAFRAIGEAGNEDNIWGSVDAYGATKEEAIALVMQALSIINAFRDDAEEYVEQCREDLYVYPIADGCAYRGGLIGAAGEPLV